MSSGAPNWTGNGLPEAGVGVWLTEVFKRPLNDGPWTGVPSRRFLHWIEAGWQANDALCNSENLGCLPVPGKRGLQAACMGNAVSCSGPRVKGLTSSAIGARPAFPKAQSPLCSLWADCVGLLPWRAPPHILPLSALIQYFINLDSL